MSAVGFFSPSLSSLTFLETFGRSTQPLDRIDARRRGCSSSVQLQRIMKKEKKRMEKARRLGSWEGENKTVQ